MTRKEINIQGNHFRDIEGLYDEIDRVLTKGLTWKTGHNLDAFNDLLHGGFGVHEYDEKIRLIWNDAEKSRNDLGYDRNGNMIFDILVEIIRAHEHIELVLQ